ncbi:MAG: BlaI/MecI/CopY family transcriptional regulator [Planctomycetaceae bacterium]|nr:BlaI/MecI/CopY family transcriptional regulator [Planctomycetaceae bacterium]
MSKKHRLADLQMAIMQVLWEKGEATVAQVRESLLPSRELAYTTVGTMLTKMEQKGQLTHRVDARVNVYKPAIKPDQVKRRMLTDLADRLFAGDVTDLVCCLLDGVDVSSDDLAELKKLIRRKEQELGDASKK